MATNTNSKEIFDFYEKQQSRPVLIFDHSPLARRKLFRAKISLYICIHISVSYIWIYIQSFFVQIQLFFNIIYFIIGRRVWRASEWRYLQSIFTNPTFLQRFRKASMASERVEILCNLFLQIKLFFKDLGRRV